MDYHTLDTLRHNHPAWRLLTADHAPLIADFLYHSFIQPNTRTLSQPELASRLDDYLYHLRAQIGADAFPKPATAYLDEWASDDHRWLRKYYPANSDEPHYDLTVDTGKAIDWLSSLLRQRQFVGTESRLLTVFELLRQMTQGSETDPQVRIAELEKRKAQIEADIQRIREGHMDLMDTTQIKDRFQQLASTARDLLSDFREVEQNFRTLDRVMRERLATWEGGKGAVLEEIFGERDDITNSDQGKSFRAFWDFLMSPVRKEELSALLEAVLALEPVKALEPDERLLRIHYDWLEAAEVTQRTVARLSEQLRRYLDDRVRQENQRIVQLIRTIEHHALAIRDHFPGSSFRELDEPGPAIDLTLDRPLFTPPLKPQIAQHILLAGSANVPTDILFEQVSVDKTRLATHIRQALQLRQQISLQELVETHPLEQGLTELVAYLSLAVEDRKGHIDKTDTQTLLWTDKEGTQRLATLPLVIFSR